MTQPWSDAERRKGAREEHAWMFSYRIGRVSGRSPARAGTARLPRRGLRKDRFNLLTWAIRAENRFREITGGKDRRCHILTSLGTVIQRVFNLFAGTGCSILSRGAVDSGDRQAESACPTRLHQPITSPSMSCFCVIGSSLSTVVRIEIARDHHVVQLGMTRARSIDAEHQHRARDRRRMRVPRCTVSADRQEMSPMLRIFPNGPRSSYRGHSDLSGNISAFHCARRPTASRERSRTAPCPRVTSTPVMLKASEVIR